ncbi:MAG: lysylphosphatidylglycerol synthase domain-containing protein [Pseudomonadota bacterium]
MNFWPKSRFSGLRWLVRLRQFYAQKWFMPGLTGVLLLLAVLAIHHMLHEVSLHELWQGLQAIPLHNLLLSVLFMFMSYLFMIGYDASALFYLKKRLPWRTVALGGFVGYAFSNTVGMALVSGASIRYRIYVAAGLTPMDIAKIAAFCALAYAAGAQLVAAAGLAWQPDLLADRLSIPPEFLRGLGIAALVLALAVLLWLIPRPRQIKLGRWQFDVPGWRLSLTLLLITALDVLFSIACLHALLPPGSVPFGTLIVVFILAAALGVASNVPAGLGVFEAVMIAALSEHIDVAQLMVALVLFRVIYYLLPLSLAAILLGMREVMLMAREASSESD